MNDYAYETMSWEKKLKELGMKRQEDDGNNEESRLHFLMGLICTTMLSFTETFIPKTGCGEDSNLSFPVL